MASVTTAQLSADLDHAIGDFTDTLTVTLPTSSASATFSATRRELQDAFSVEENGRSTKLDTRFYLNVNGVTPYPKKGWVFTDTEGRAYKVVSDFLAADEIGLTLDCEARYSKGV
ncbi:MAG: hypothetical protein CMI54_08985 [Parcubacteria group bacterium]|jgi:hypothetical protein|nr:hypothetical protein [Parcubacteria group bacterium]|tara:strand:- start:11862 stop:12206 length:345 start_codon:yes stop_codon:yes gene_type:complete